MFPLVPFLFFAWPQADQLIPPGIADKSPAFWAGAVAVLWIVERVFGYALQFRKELTPENVALAVKQSLTTSELEAMRAELAQALQADQQAQTMARQIGILFEWHNREDPERPGWKIWWTSSKDFKKLIELSERQSQIDRDLLAALDRRAELDRMMMSTLEQVSRASSTAASEAALARAVVRQCLAEIKLQRRA